MNSISGRAEQLLSVLERVQDYRELEKEVPVAWDLVEQLRRAGDLRGAQHLASRLGALSATEIPSPRFSLIEIDILLAVGAYPLAAERLRALLNMFDSKSAPATAQYRLKAQIKLGYAEFKLNLLEPAAFRLSRAYSELVSRPDGPDLGWCACNLGNVAWAKGDLRDAQRRYLESMVSADRCGSMELAATSKRNLGLVYRQQCRWRNSREFLEESFQLWKSLENADESAHLARALAILEFKSGRLKEARRLCELSLDLASNQESESGEFGSLLMGQVSLHEGGLAASSEVLVSVVTSKLGSEFDRPHLLATEFLGDVHLEQGQAAEALKHYDEVWPKAMALVPKGDIVAELRRRRAECYLLLGRNAEAYSAAKEGLDHCRELGDRYEEAATYRVLALSAAAVGRHDEARQHFTQGFAYYDDIETPYEWGKLWMAYGDWLLGSGAGPHEDRSAAREAYLAARDYFSNMGARAKLREAEARLKTLDAEAAIATTPASSESDGITGPASIIRRPQRRPASQTEIDRRSDGAWHDWYIITRNEPLLNALDRAAKLARSDVPILVTGETGTGKELVASGIHRASRLEGNYIPLNCAAVPKEMIESELFGHVRGAFSGAIAERQGLVEMAARGTLFLDEVGEMSEAMQAKLLRFLESGEYRRVGEGAHRIAKTRLVAATNVSRERLEKGEGFRHDLFWRLAQGCLEIPALRHRQGDVPLLVDHFFRLESRKMDKLSLTISEAAHAELTAYAWPGNVRELVGVMRRAVALAEHTIEPEHLDLTSTREVAVTLTEEMAAAERVKLARAMKEHGDSPTAAARALGIPRTTLLMKLKRYGMR